MKCQFCNHPLKFSHNENNKEVEVYDCLNCPVLTSFYLLHKEGTPIKTTFMLDRNERFYMWTNHYLNNNSYISVLDGATAVRTNPILKFPKVMNLTPQNVYEKFAFYMVFL
jgi:hypothetical protein